MKVVSGKIELFIHIGTVLCLAVFNIIGINGIWNSRMRDDERSVITDRQEWESEEESQDVFLKQTEKIAYLTFDDGPSDNTDLILDILKEKGVKATFFVIGKTGTKAKERYRRIVKEGHTLGIHSYTHRYEEIYASLENFKDDVRRMRDYLYEVTGEKVWAYRFPGGSSNQVAKVEIRDCISFLKEEGMVYFDWNASSEDAVATGVSCSVLNENVLKDALRFQYPMILMHDLQSCNGTVEGLGKLIDRMQEEGYELCGITKETKPVQHVK